MRPRGEPELNERIYLVVMHIPRGMVATYGDIATIIGGGIEAREIGYALGDLPQARNDEVPWQRVVARDGVVSTRGLRQRELLEAEGVEFDARDRVVMARFHWPGPSSEWATEHGFHTLPPREEPGEQLSMF